MHAGSRMAKEEREKETRPEALSGKPSWCPDQPIVSCSTKTASLGACLQIASCIVFAHWSGCTITSVTVTQRLRVMLSSDACIEHVLNGAV